MPGQRANTEGVFFCNPPRLRLFFVLFWDCLREQVGTIFEAFQDVMQEVNSEEEEPEGCSNEEDVSMGEAYGIEEMGEF